MRNGVPTIGFCQQNKGEKALQMSFHADSDEREVVALAYRERARELRVRGKCSRNEQLARSFLAIAEAYELLADSASVGAFCGDGDRSRTRDAHH